MRFLKQQSNHGEGERPLPPVVRILHDFTHRFPGVPKHTDPRHVRAEHAARHEARAAQVKARHEAHAARAKERAMRWRSRSAQ